MNLFNSWSNWRKSKPKSKLERKAEVALRIKELDLGKLISPENPVEEFPTRHPIGVSDTSFQSNRKIGDNDIHIFARRIIGVSGVFFTIIALDVGSFGEGKYLLAFSLSLHSENRTLNLECASKSEEVRAEFKRISLELIKYFNSK